MEIYFPNNNKDKYKIQLPKLPDYTKMKKEKISQFFRSDRSTSESRTKVNESQQKLIEFLAKNKVSNEDRQTIEQHIERREKVDIIKLEKRGSLRPILQRIQFDTLPIYTPKRPVKTEQDSISSQSDVNFDKESQEYIFSESEEDDEHPKKTSKTKEIQHEISQIQHRLNQESSDSFFRYIKQQDKFKDLALNFKHDSLNPIYYYSTHDDLFPKRIDLSNLLIDHKEINFSDMQVNQKYFPILKNLLRSRKCTMVKQLYLCNNKLNERILKEFIDAFPIQLKVLNLSNNELGKRGAILLSTYLSNLMKYFNVFSSLKSLNLANNQLSEAGCSIILTSLFKSQMLTKLNLSENQVNDSLAATLYSFLLQNSSVEVLQISWNQLGPCCGTMIAKGLQQNRYLKVLDLSYNKLGQHEQSQCVNMWSEAILNPAVTLIHLDLSFNQFNENQLKQLIIAFNKNNTIYGLHIEGNKFPAYVDPYGFIQLQNNDNEKLKQVQRKKHQIDGVNYIPMNSDQNIGNDCCWICQGWMEHRFVYIPDHPHEQEPIFLHLDFLDFKPIPMTTSFELRQQYNNQIQKKNSILELTTGEINYQLKHIVQLDKKITMAAIEEAYKSQHIKAPSVDSLLIEDLNKFYYTTYQMCPPKRRILYFFSNPMSEDCFIDKTALNIPSPMDNLILQGKDPKHQNHVFSDGTLIPFRKVHKVNYLLSKQEYVIDDKNNYQPLIKIFPRSSEKKYVLRKFANNQLKKKHNLTIWGKDNSYFKQSLGDSEEIVNECFEFDWNCSKIQRFVKSDYERQKLKEYLRNSYPLLKDVYKYYSSFGYVPPVYDTFCIQFPQFIKILTQMNTIDGELLKLQDVEINLVSIKNNIEQKLLYNPDKALIRYQFLEIFFRIANDKYMRTNICKNYADAIFRILKEFEQSFSNFDRIQEWRSNRLWTKECDYLFTFKSKFIKKLYDYATDLSNRKWYFKLKWISIKEFVEFCRQMNINEFLNEKQLIVIYNFSMQSQIDEVSQDRNIRMSQIEFAESLARIAEQISPAPVGEKVSENCDSDKYWTLSKRQMLPLHIKLESILTHIYSRAIKRDPEFELFSNYFEDLQLPDGARSLFLPRTHEKQSEEEFVNDADYLSICNTMKFIRSNEQPYLPPHYLKYLQKPFNLAQPAFGAQPLINPRKLRTLLTLQRPDNE